MRVELPFPPSELNPNRRNGRHWGATSEVKAKYRSDCFYATVAAVGPSPRLPLIGPGLPLSLTFVLPTKRRPDADNLLASAKAAIDGFAAALKVDDKVFEPLTVRRIPGAKPGALILEIA